MAHMHPGPENIKKIMTHFWFHNRKTRSVSRFYFILFRGLGDPTEASTGLPAPQG